MTSCNGDDDYVDGERECPNDVGSYVLKLLNNWLKPKNYKKLSKIASFSLHSLFQPSRQITSSRLCH